MGAIGGGGKRTVCGVVLLLHKILSTELGDHSRKYDKKFIIFIKSDMDIPETIYFLFCFSLDCKADGSYFNHCFSGIYCR